MKEHVEAARRIARSHLDGSTNGVALVIVEALDRAGLLRTGLEKRAVEACEAYAKANTHGEPATFMDFARPVVTVGRESLALKQPPKPRWTVIRTVVADEWAVIEGTVTRGAPTFMPLTEARAKAVAAALNACDTETRDA